MSNVNPTLPVDDLAAANEIAEGAANGTAVAGFDASSTDPNGPPVTFSLTDNAGGRFAIDASSGVLSVLNGTLLNFETATSHQITVQASDGAGGTSTYNFIINVSNVSPAQPVDDLAAANEIAEGAANGTAVAGFDASSTDPNGPPVTFSLTDNAGGRFAIDASTGVLTVANGALLDFESATNHQITVQASDGAGGTSTQNFTINVSNVAPVAIGDGYSVSEDNTLNVVAAGVLGNDNDVNGGAITAVLDLPPANAASFALQNDGSFSYTPNANFNGADIFTYRPHDGTAPGNLVTVNLTINEVNDAPTATDDGLTPVAEDNAKIIPFAGLTGNDIEGPANEAGQSLTVTVVNNAIGGTVQIVGGNVHFTPTANFNGAASFDYTTTDNGTTSGVADPKSDVGHATFTVTEINDAPVNVLAGAQTAPRNADYAIAGLDVSDVDAGAGTLTTTLSVDHGTLAVASAGGAAVGGSGTDTVTLTGTLGQIHTTLSAAGNVVYNSNLNFVGTDTLTMVSNDGGNTGTGGVLSDTDAVTIQVDAKASFAPSLVNWTSEEPFPDQGGWYVGDFNGDDRDDIFRYHDGVSGAEVFLSNGSSFVGGASWTGASNGSQGWYVGDFDGDNRDDIFRYNEGVSGAEVFLSNGSSFVSGASWTGAGNDGRWYIGDFNGDGRDDIFRYNPGVSGAEVFLSNGSEFVFAGSWTGAGTGSDGTWHVGDFDGDGDDDIFRYLEGQSGADMFLSNGSSAFVHDGSWTPAGSGSDGTWHIGDFNGDGEHDIFRYLQGQSGADMFLSSGSEFVYDQSWTPAGFGSDNRWYTGDFDGDGSSDVFRHLAGQGAEVLL